MHAQTRVEQITKLKSGTLDMDRTEGSISIGKGSNSAGTENLKDNEVFLIQ